VSAIPSCFCSVNVFAPGKSPIEVQTEILDIILLRKVYVVYMDLRAGFSLCGECDMDLLGLAFICLFFNHFWNAFRLVCNFCEAMPGPLSMANIAVSSANFAVVDFVGVGRWSVYRIYNSGPRTLPWRTPALTVESSAYSDSVCTRKCLLCRWDLSRMK
jgi:hypothetical protein